VWTRVAKVRRGSNMEQRGNIKFRVRLDYTATKNFTCCSEVYRDNCLSHARLNGTGVSVIEQGFQKLSRIITEKRNATLAEEL